jgi:hypothetical protein
VFALRRDRDPGLTLDLDLALIDTSSPLPRRPPRPHDRPLRQLPHPELMSHFAKALLEQDGIAGAHCIHERWMRGGEFAQDIEQALEQLWQHAAKSIPEWLPMRYVSWLPQAYEIASRFEASAKGRYNIYLVLLDYADRRGDAHGVYVGMSHYKPAERFDQHKAGIRAAGSVLKRGIEVLTGPTLHLQRISRAHAVRIEMELAAALGDTGIRVEGGH